ncbi:uncharacterized protein si:ch211-214p13.8 [Thalassophryne amazonica]|uniref:uncharacterized protein si:ch211-214p13.8 n=1 Tax=Thalassophryne amazonica TaxID=390379 RepID=UPI00147180DF|nr:uncharacterized protein si:ch211-214p13.8 [Thalassophryne amazonica]
MHRMSTSTFLVFCSLAFVGFVGTFGKNLDPSCKVAVKVQSGTTWKAVPQKKLTINCTAKHCGETFLVTWYKSDTKKYEQINDTVNVKIRQSNTFLKDELISFLEFKRISTQDAGLYSCKIQAYKYAAMSHFINVLVSDNNRAVGSYRNGTYDSVFSAAKDEALYNNKVLYWLPYFAICVGIVLLVLLLTVIAKLSLYCYTRLQINNQPKCQEMPTQRLPDIPKGSFPFPPVIQTHRHNPFVYSLERPSEIPYPPAMSNVVNTAEKCHQTDNPLYNYTKHLPSENRQ